MDAWLDINWFALQAKPHHEERAAARLTHIVEEVFLPMVKSARKVCGTRRMVVSPFFTGYLFARFSPSVSLNNVRHAQGIVRVLGNHGQPFPLGSNLVTDIQELLENDGYIHQKVETFLPGDRVSINDGPLAGWVGRVVREADDGKRTLILLDAIEQARVLVERGWLKVMET